MNADAFTEAARQVGCTVVRVPTQDAVADAVSAICIGRRTIADDLPVLRGVLLGHPCPHPWDAEVGVAQAIAASASTGTVALARRPGAARATSVLPYESVVVVDAATIVDDYAALVNLVATLDPMPSNVQLVTGASRSGDVEAMTVHGMHGPAALTLVVHGGD